MLWSIELGRKTPTEFRRRRVGTSVNGNAQASLRMSRTLKWRITESSEIEEI